MAVILAAREPPTWSPARPSLPGSQAEATLLILANSVSSGDSRGLQAGAVGAAAGPADLALPLLGGPGGPVFQITRLKHRQRWPNTLRGG